MMREAKVELKENRLQRTFDALEGPNDCPNDYQMVLGTANGTRHARDGRPEHRSTLTCLQGQVGRRLKRDFARGALARENVLRKIARGVTAQAATRDTRKEPLRHDVSEGNAIHKK